uniref:Serine protease easter-like n=1 Tax=Drosophila rhopaloa TaxID=1041015 RepID=A0A6P4EVQ8_DRORH
MCVYFILGVLPALLTPIAGLNCGNLRENQLYSRNEITAPDEYPWIGRIGYVHENGTTFTCFAVLIHQRYAIATAFCALSNADFDTLFILFGDWRENENFKVRDCRREGNIFQCSPPPQKVEIDELVVHPEYKNDLHNNIALAKLVRDVEFTDYVQPICLPPVKEADGNQIAQRLEIAGFRRPLWKGQEADEEGEWRRKVQVFTASRDFCESVAYPDWQNMTTNHLCALGDEEKTLYFGSPLMGIKIVDEKPKNFYLVALPISYMLLYSPKNLTLQVFVRIAPYRDWILKNTALV